MAAASHGLLSLPAYTEFMQVLAKAVLVSAMIFFPAVAPAQQTQSHRNRCTGAQQEQALDQAQSEGLSGWARLYRAFKLYPGCEKSETEDYYTPAATTLLEDWPTAGKLSALAAADPAFLQFVLRHIDGYDEELLTIGENARMHCPPGSDAMCHQIVQLDKIKTAEEWKRRIARMPTGPDCSGNWPTDMAFVYLKNAGITDNEKVDFSKTKTQRITSQRIGRDLYHQVYDVTFTEYSGRTIEAIALHDVSSVECSMTDVKLYVVSQILAEPPRPTP